MCVLYSEAVLFVADLGGAFGFNGGVYNAVVFKLISDCVFYGVRVLVCDDMHSGIMVMAVKASDVNMVNICDALNGKQVIFYLFYADIIGCLFKGNLNNSLNIFHSIDEYENCNSHRHKWVDDVKVGESHHYSTYQYSYPAEDIFKHMQINSFLIYRVAVTGDICRCKVNRYPHKSEDYHAIIVDFHRVDESAHSLSYNQYRADNKHDSCDKSA